MNKSLPEISLFRPVSWLLFVLTYVMSYGEPHELKHFSAWEVHLSPVLCAGVGLLYCALRPRLSDRARERWGIAILALIGAMFSSHIPSAFVLAATAPIERAISDARPVLARRLPEAARFLTVSYGLMLLLVPFFLFGSIWALIAIVGVIWFLLLVVAYLKPEGDSKTEISPHLLLLAHSVVSGFAAWWVYTGLMESLQTCIAEVCYGWSVDIVRCRAKCVLTHYLSSFLNVLGLVVFVAYLANVAHWLRARWVQAGQNPQ